MKIELRVFKEARHLLLIPERDSEVAQLDNFFGDDLSHFDNKKIKKVILCTDDDFKPYIRIESAEVE